MSYDAPSISLEAARQARAQQIADAEHYRIVRLARKGSNRSRIAKTRSRSRPFVRPRPVS